MHRWILLTLCSALTLALFTCLGPSLPAEAAMAAVGDSGDPNQGGYVGSVSCRSCHEKFYELWATSHHGLAMQPFTPELARKALTEQPEPILIEGKHYQAHFGPQDSWVTETGPDGEKRYPVEHAMGGKNVYFFLTPMERGRLQVLPLSYDVRKKEWYNTAGSMLRHFGDDQTDTALSWKDPLFTFNNACYQCHVSQLRSNYDLKTDTYRTEWAEPGINCETCHGPGQAHIEACQTSPDTPPKDMKLTVVMQKKGFTADQVDTSCAPCHAKMAPLTTDFQPGDNYFDHYDLTTLEDPDFYPDGRDLGENYTYTQWLMNPCTAQGKLDCMHCHTSSGRYRFNGEGDKANEACLPCHQDRVKNAVEHTHHEANTEGNRCISCHMPMTEFARMRRSDHSMRPPMPAASQAFQSPNACTLCHDDKDAAWANEEVRKWHPEDYQKSELEAGRLIAAARKNDWSGLNGMIAWIRNNRDRDVFVNSLVRLMRGCTNDAKWPLMLELLQTHPSPLVRSSAADVVGDHLIEEHIKTLAQAASDPYLIVRMRAGFALASVPDDYFQPAQRAAVQKARQEFLASTKALPDNWTAHFNLGVFLMAQNKHREAIEAFETAHQRRGDILPPLINASMAWNLLGDNARAEECLRTALKIDPKAEAVHLNLALLLAEEQRFAEAEKSFRTVLDLNSKSSVAAYNLAVLVAQRDVADAVYWARKAYENAPDQDRYGYAYAAYLNQARRTDEAVTVLQKLVDRQTGYAAVYFLLGHLYQSDGRTADTLSLYRKALNSDAVSPQDKARFAQQIEMLSMPSR